MLKYIAHSYIKFIVMHSSRADSFCNMMFTPVQCQVSFWWLWWCGTKAAVFIVSMTALMMSDPFFRQCLEENSVVGNQRATKGSFSPLNVVTSGEPCVQPTSSFNLCLVFFHSFYSSPYSISTNRMIAQTSITPFIAASPVSTYQVGGASSKFAGLSQALRACKTVENNRSIL